MHLPTLQLITVLMSAMSGLGRLSMLQTSSTFDELFVTLDQKSYKITKLCICKLAALIQPSTYFPTLTVMTLVLTALFA